MTNLFNVRAAEAGRQFVFDKPMASGPDVDKAAPLINPTRRHFQQAAQLVRDQIVSLGPVWYRWEVKTTEDRVVGFCKWSDEAMAETMLWVKLARQDGEIVTGYTIENQDGKIISGVSFR